MKEGGLNPRLIAFQPVPEFFNQSILSIKYYLIINHYNYNIIKSPCQQILFLTSNKTKPHKIPLSLDRIYNIIIYTYFMTTNPYIATVTGLFLVILLKIKVYSHFRHNPIK